MIYSRHTKNKLLELIEYVKPDVIHNHNIYGRLTSSIIDAGKEGKIPSVMTLHDYKMSCPSYLMLLNGITCNRCKGKYFYNCLISRCHKNSLSASAVYTIESYFNRFLRKYKSVRYFICPSMFSLNIHRDAGIQESKLVHIPNFVWVRDFKPEYDRRKYILFVGRLSKEKGIMTLLRAFEGVDATLIIVGDGPLKQDYESYADERKMENVEFKGYKRGRELEELFRDAAFLVFPSEWYENAPMTILEAFAYGKPVIGSSIGGIPEMVSDEETGYLFSAGDHNELRERIIELLQNPSKIESMGRRARERVERDNNSEQHYKMIQDVYRTAMLE